MSRKYKELKKAGRVKYEEVKTKIMEKNTGVGELKQIVMKLAHHIVFDEDIDKTTKADYFNGMYVAFETFEGISEDEQEVSIDAVETKIERS